MDTSQRCMWVVLCLTLVALGHGAPLQSRLGAGRLQNQAPLCGSCRWLVKSVKCELSDVDTQSEIIGMVLKDVCPNLPADAQEACGQLAPSLIPLGIMYIQSLSANELCADANLCGAAPPQSKAARLGAGQQNDFNCPICKMLLITIKQELRNPESEKELIDRAHEACKTLPTDWQAPCTAYVDQFGEQIFAYIENIDPTTICTNFGACMPSQLLSNTSMPPLPLALVAKAADLRMRAHEHSATNDFCDTCKMVITEAAAILGNLDTQKQILEYAKEACQAFGPNFKDQCLNYVELYGPLVVNMIVQYLKPQLCIDAGYCPQPSSLNGMMHSI